MMGGIPNPRKTLKVNFSLVEVEKALSTIARHVPNCEFTSHDSIMNTFEYKFSEFLSVGSRMTVDLQEIGAQTILEVEQIRVLGAYDDWVEVSRANRQIKDFSTALSLSLAHPNGIPADKQPDTSGCLGAFLAIITLGGSLLYFLV